MSSERKRRGWKILGGLLGALVLFVGTSWGWLRVVENRKWAAMERRVAELSAESLPANPERWPLVGDPVPGNACADYEKALAQLSVGTLHSQWRELAKKVDDYVRTREESLRVEAAAILNSFGPWMDAVRRGARRATARGPLSSADSEAVSFISGLLRNRACLIVAVTPDEATDTLLDLLQFGVDLDSIEFAEGKSVCLTALDGLNGIFEAIPMNRRTEVERALQRAEDSLSPARDYRGQIRNVGQALLRKPLNETFLTLFKTTWWETVKYDWKFGFSMRHVAADCFGWLDRWMSQTLAWEDLPYLEMKARMSEQEKEFKSCPNRVAARMGLMGIVTNQWKWREIVARARLLRAACGAEGLKDPFGDQIRSILDGDKIRFWSVGPDGIDQGGRGSRQWNNDVDLVLQVSR